MTELKIIAPDLKEGIDRKLLKNLKERFLSVNEGRLQRTLEALSARHRAFLHVLPLLLHVNHASLPGYVSPKTPAGVRYFTPDKEHLRAAQIIARAFTYHTGKPIDPDIVGIYLMGSTGTIAQSDKSDLDFWICHRSDLPDNGIHELRRKLDALSLWADNMGLEAHFFLMDAEKFKRGERGDVSGEDCGSAQHYLLLDEFYRSSLLVAGCAPLWWMIPAYEEHQYDAYANELLAKRFIATDEFIDFGGISKFPAGEFVGAGLWQLYKGIDSPYKSVLKIVLTEVYASEHPQVECLSLCFKKAVYHGETTLDELDPYVMMYRKIEEYLLSRQEVRRLELIRHCFYFKVNEAISRDTGSKQRTWRYLLMERLAHTWRWDHAYIKQLDNRKHWRVTRVRQERQELVYELNYSYRLLSTFARENNIESSIRQEDMHLLGRRLHAAFERKGGKIEMVNPGITSNLEEEALSFLFIRDEDHPGLNDHWAVHRGYIKLKDLKGQEPLRKSRSLIEMLAWCYFNKLIDHATRITTDSTGTDLTEAELQRIVLHFSQLYPKGLEKAAEQAFRFAACPMHLALFINVGLDPLRELTKRGIHRLSNHTDALSYSAMHHNLVLTVDQVMINSWGEVICTRYDSGSALMDCLLDYLRQVPSEGAFTTPSLQVRCECPTRAAAIASRVEELFNDVIACYYSQQRSINTRYLLEIEQQHYLLQYQREKPVMRVLRSQPELLEALAETQPSFSRIVIDRHALARHPLREVIRTGVASRVQVYYQKQSDQKQGETADVWVHDENGSIFYTSRPWRDEASLVTPFQHFFESIYLRRNATSEKLSPAVRTPVYYEILVNGNDIRSERRKTPSQVPLMPWHNVQAIAETTTGTDIYYTIYCDSEEFSQLDHGEQIYAKVATYITTRRRNQARYPVYITDLDLTPLANSRRQPLSTGDYLRHKESLERAINAALKLLASP